MWASTWATVLLLFLMISHQGTCFVFVVNGGAARRCGIRSKLQFHESTSSDQVATNPSPMTGWKNTDVEPDVLREAWEKHDPLMTVGASGVTDSLKSGLYELTKSHNIVKVKLASNKVPAMDIANLFMEDNRVSETVRLLEVRPRGFTVQRHELIPPKPRRIRLKLDSVSGERTSIDSEPGLPQRRPRKKPAPAPPLAGGARRVAAKAKRAAATKRDSDTVSSRASASRSKSFSSSSGGPSSKPRKASSRRPSTGPTSMRRSRGSKTD